MMAIAHLAEVTIRVPDSLRDSIRARLGCLITFLRLQMRPLLPRLFSFFLSYLISFYFFEIKYRGGRNIDPIVPCFLRISSSTLNLKPLV